MKYLLTLCLLIVAGTASAQCPGGVCPVVRKVTRTRAVATPVVAVAAPVAKPAPIAPPPAPAVVVKPTAPPAGFVQKPAVVPTTPPLPMAGPAKTVAVKRERVRWGLRDFGSIVRLRMAW